MRSWSLFLGRYFGVELRLHSFFVMLLPLLMLLSSALSGSGLRGLALWLLLLFAVLVRETARVLALAYFHQPVGRLVLLPTGALPPENSAEQAAARRSAHAGSIGERLIALTGPLANFAMGLTVALLIFSVTSQIHLFDRPFVTSSHLVRSIVWTQIMLGGLHLLPAYPLDAGLLFRRQLRRAGGSPATVRAASGLTSISAWTLILAGAALQNPWFLVLGTSILIASRSEMQTALARNASSSVTVGDVMLTEYTTIAASDTLEEALERSVHSLQDVFPVVRGPVIVGAVARQSIAEALRTGGNSYVQSAMTRTLEVTSPSDPLFPTLERVHLRGGAQLLPVVQDGRVLGIVTPQNLSHSIGLLGQTRRALSRDERQRDAPGE